MSDFLKTNWFEKIRTDPIVNEWSWIGEDGETHYLGEYIFQDTYIPSNVPKVKQTNKTSSKPNKVRKKRKRKKQI